MALIYEHWRPDTNEGFYVGASCGSEDARPYFYGDHNDDYNAVVAHLNENHMKPFTKIVWEDLEEDCVGTYEKIRISYQRAMLGKNLTNKTKGGFGFPEISGSNHWKATIDEDIAAKIFIAEGAYKNIAEYFGVTEYVVTDIKQKASWKCIHPIPNLDYDLWLKNHQSNKSLLHKNEKLNFLKTSDGQQWRVGQSKRQLDFLNTEKGENWRREQSQRKLDFYSSPEGEKWRQKKSRAWTGKFAGGKHPLTKLSEEKAQAILDFVGSHASAAREFGVSWDIAHQIRKRKTWRHLTPKG
jgi:hypothetical protein